MSDGEEDLSKDLLDIEVFSMFLEVQTKLLCGKGFKVGVLVINKEYSEALSDQY